MALRLRRSSFIKDYLTSQSQEEENLSKIMSDIPVKKTKSKKTKSTK
jgi:hypothetical protein